MKRRRRESNKKKKEQKKKHTRRKEEEEEVWLSAIRRPRNQREFVLRTRVILTPGA